MLRSCLGIGVICLALTTPASSGPNIDDGFEGLIEPSRRIALGVATEGRLESIAVDRGDRVEAGQLLGWLECGVEQAALKSAEVRSQATAEIETAQVRIEDLERKLEQFRSLVEGGASSLDELRTIETELALARLARRQAEHAVELATIQAEEARARIRRRQIHSPVNGVVVARNISVGELSVGDKGAEAITIAVVDPLHVKVVLPAEMRSRVRPGTEAQVFIPGFDPPRVATVDRLDPINDSATQTFEVLLALPNPGGALPAGLQGLVHFPR